ncbi:MAG: RidA family protein [Gordonia sp. (in: high G+C Gram-positive bacteria)]|uniref:RidA family protein n=1 Tax=Gordonia sp. (in: high G+C Gram-positive bacteria) TaxID=84139 RepID=UPI0039E3FB53
MSGGAVRRFRAPGLHDGGFVHGAVVPSGATVFTAGISPLDDDGAIVGVGDATEQTHRCLECLAAVLDEAGASPAGIAKLTVYVATADPAVLGQVWQAVDAGFPETPPAIVLGVTALPYPGQLVELDAVAAAEH